MMNMDKSLILNNYSTSLNAQSSPLAMARVSFYGLEPNEVTANGLALTLKSWLINDPNTTIKFTSEPNTITIHRIRTHLSSNGSYSSTTTKTSSPRKTMFGTLSEKDLMSWLQSTLPIVLASGLIALALWSSGLMASIITTFSK